MPAEFVEVEGDGGGAVEPGELCAAGGAEQEPGAVGRVDVEAGTVVFADVGDLREGVDEARVGRSGGGGDEFGSGQVGEGFVERRGVEGAGGRGHGDGVGQAEEPGSAGQGVVGVGAGDELEGAL